MPLSALASSPKRKSVGFQRGFTLIEVLMVVLLVGVISGIVVMSASPQSPERSVVHELDRLAAVIALAVDEAQAENTELGLKVAVDGYAFVAFNEQLQEWGPYLADDSFKPRQLENGVVLRIIRENRIQLPRVANTPNGEEALKWQPDILFLSSGESTPAALELSSLDAVGAEQTFEIDELGGITRSDRVDEEAADV